MTASTTKRVYKANALRYDARVGLVRRSLLIGTDTIRHRHHAKRGDQNGEMSYCSTLGSNRMLMELIGRLVGEQIICSFTEQLSGRSSQSLQLRGIYDV